MVEVRNLVKRYGKTKALDDVSFSVGKGEIVGFLGVNGAGKSTTLNSIVGYSSIDSGEIFIDSENIFDEPLKTREKIGYLPEIPPLYLDMTVFEYLKFCYNLKKIKNKNKDEHINEICNRLDILDVKERLIKNLSKGYKQRVGLGMALLGEPPIIILDEPSVGLDPRQVVEMRNLVRDLGKDHTVILSSHILSEVQEICTRIVIISSGRVIADDSTSNILHKLSNGKNLIFKIEGPIDKVEGVLKNVDGIKDLINTVKKSDDIFEYEVSLSDLPQIDARRNVFLAMAKNLFPILDIKSDKSSLENVFLELTHKNEHSIVIEDKETKDNVKVNEVKS